MMPAQHGAGQEAPRPAPWHSLGNGKDVAQRNRDGREEIMRRLPRYVRINTLKCTFAEAKRALKETGHVLEVERRVRNEKAWRRHKPDQKTNGRAYKRDKDVRELLVFRPKGKSDLSRVPLIRSGALIVQQKASCFPTLALAPPPGAHVIDACAAPGSKTSHIAALLQNQGVVFAFDRSAQRLENLRKLVAARGATCVRPKVADFMTVDPADSTYSQVSHILLDPSCSSSGMSTTATTDPAQLAALVTAQRAMIRHAMKFPSVSVIVYSTCSVHAVENEEAVDDVIATTSGWKTERVLPWWHRRGLPSARCAEDVVRTTLEDKTIGFFVGRLIREAKETHHADERRPAIEDKRKPDGQARMKQLTSATVPIKPTSGELDEQLDSHNMIAERMPREQVQKRLPDEHKRKGRRKRKRVVVVQEDC